MYGTVQYVQIESAGVVAMGKYVGYVILILIVLFAVEYFGIVDIPYFDIPDQSCPVIHMNVM